jgi:hypothetical protein
VAVSQISKLSINPAAFKFNLKTLPAGNLATGKGKKILSFTSRFIDSMHFPCHFHEMVMASTGLRFVGLFLNTIGFQEAIAR